MPFSENCLTILTRLQLYLSKQSSAFTFKTITHETVMQYWVTNFIPILSFISEACLVVVALETISEEKLKIKKNTQFLSLPFCGKYIVHRVFVCIQLMYISAVNNNVSVLSLNFITVLDIFLVFTSSAFFSMELFLRLDGRAKQCCLLRFVHYKALCLVINSTIQRRNKQK